jgi:ribulose-5-phosphate 4-epimerase/fuculose-1-phosphate aldolase
MPTTLTAPARPAHAPAPRADLPFRINERPFRLDWFEETPPQRTIAQERQFRREQLAITFRLFARHGLNVGLAGHVTARDPEWTDHFWVNPLGLNFSQIRVSDLLLVNRHGEIVVGEGPLNRAAFAIHAALHEARPDIVAAAHTHSTYGKAWSALGRLLDPLTQDACVFYEDHALFDDFSGVVLETTEGQRIAQALGQRKAVILRNHGILTAGPSVAAAAWWYIALENACHTQLLAEAVGTPKPIPHEVARLTHSQIGGPRGAQATFDDLARILVREEPEVLQ